MRIVFGRQRSETELHSPAPLQMPKPELLTESIHLGDVTVDLNESSVEISVADPTADDPEEDEYWVSLAPTTRREANQLSMALRKASRRLEDIAANLPEAN